MLNRPIFRLFCALVSLFCLTNGWAQAENEHPETQPMKHVAMASQESSWMRKKLNLSAKQYTEISEVNLYYARIRAENATQQQRQIPTPDELQKIVEKEQELEVEKENWYKVLLTPNQWHVYQKKKKNKLRRIGARPGVELARP